MKFTHGEHPADALFGADFKDHPYALYDEMRANEPVAWNEAIKAWVVSREADVAHVLKDGKTFSSNRVAPVRKRFPARYDPLFDALSLLMVQRDGRDHKRLRDLTQVAFKRTAVASYQGEIRRIADDLLAKAPADGRFAYKSGFAVPLPVLVISEIVGVPIEDQVQVKAWCDDFAVVALNFYAQISDEALDRGLQSLTAFREYLTARVAALQPGDTSLLASLVAAEAAGGKLTADELLANVILLLNAGNETTTILLTNAMHLLVSNPGALARLRADRRLIPGAVEEMLRYQSPVQFLGRVASRDTAIGGRDVKAGDLVLVFLGSAGRDEARTDAADRFLVDRANPHHVSFGAGAHACAGLQLARLEAQIALNAMLDSFEEITLAPEPLVIGPNQNLRCVEELPLMVRRASPG